jgi:hypothetical protein
MIRIALALALLATTATARDYAREPWTLEHGRGVPKYPTATKAGWRVKVPSAPGAISYARTIERHSLRGASSVAIQVKIAASKGAVFGFPKKDNPGTAPVSVRPMIMRSMHGANGRFWATDGIPLAPGEHTLRVPLHPAHWSNVNGRRADSPAAATAWGAMRGGDAHICLTFGGGSFFGHGARMDRGAATLELISYRLR